MNKKLIALVGLVLAVVVTTFSVSGTYAKYTSSNSVTDKARVAKWGITGSESPVTIDLFDKTHTNVKTGSDEEKIIAPGTSGSYEFTLSEEVYQASEVGYKITSKVEIDDQIGELIYWIDGKDTYAAQKDSTTYTKDTIAEAIQDVLKEDVAAESAATGKTKHTLHWAWLYETEADTAGNDKTDTGLGTTGTATVTITVTITATQENPGEANEKAV